MTRSYNNRLSRRVDETVDHVLGPANARITLVEYGSYDCPRCRAANDVIANLRDEFGDRLRYVFRHKPLPGSELTRRAAELVERTTSDTQFWEMHVRLMTGSEVLTEEDLRGVAAALHNEVDVSVELEVAEQRAKNKVDADLASAEASGVLVTPTFFINGWRYKGAWDQHSLTEAMRRTPGHRVRSATTNFIHWGPSAGVLLLIASVLAVTATNSPYGPGFAEFWQWDLGLSIGDTSFQLSLQDWVNDGLLTLFFLVVGLEIKRELTVGHLASVRSAALPIAAALGGMLMPALIYSLVIPDGPWAVGWGVPISTDTAFAVALIAALGRRAPVELRVFLTAAAVVDDIGAILVIAVFYSSDLHLEYLVAAGVITVGLALLNWAHFYRIPLYLILGAILWTCIFAGGLHATLAGVILAAFIPTKPPANINLLTSQASAVLTADARLGGALRNGPSLQALDALDAIHDRLESPAARLLRHAGTRSSYVVLPLFALANAGVLLTGDVFSSRAELILAIVAGLVLGKPVGMVLASMLVVWLGLATKPDAYSWFQLVGAGTLAGIGFTVSLFVASQVFTSETDLAAVKIAVFIASLLAAAVGTLMLWRASDDGD